MEPPSTSSPQARRLWQYSSLMTMITQAKIQRSRVRVPSSIRVNRRRFMSRLQLIANLSGTKSRRNFRLFIICKSSVFTIETTLGNSHLPRFRIGDRNRLLGLLPVRRWLSRLLKTPCILSVQPTIVRDMHNQFDGHSWAGTRLWKRAVWV